MNARTLLYIKRFNPPAGTRIANNKLATKQVLQAAKIATPRLFSIIGNRRALTAFDWSSLPDSFVLKPTASSGGGGIVVIFGRNKKGLWVKADKTPVLIPELKNRVLDILDGNFSKGNVPDVAFFEQRVKNHPALKHYSVKGIPDIRILVFNMIPVMAMLRLPTEESGGKANLHAGGLGVGIDLATGMTTTALYRGSLVDAIPGTRLLLSDIHIPYWEDILLMAVQAAQAAGLGYAGVDIAIDREEGPMVLELNARPGLGIQLANMAPLRSRLQRVEGLQVKKPEKAVRIAVNLFGEEHEHDTSDVSDKNILGIEEEVTVIDPRGNAHTLMAKVDTGAWRTTIDKEIAQSWGLTHSIVGERHVRAALGDEMRPVIELTMKLKGSVVKTQAFITDRSHLNYPMIIGRRDMRGFFVDPSKRFQKMEPVSQKNGLAKKASPPYSSSHTDSPKS